jgi:hypothetical protein
MSERAYWWFVGVCYTIYMGFMLWLAWRDFSAFL